MRPSGVSRVGFYEWLTRQHTPAARTLADWELTATIQQIHRQSGRTYGAPRVHAELVLGMGMQVGRKRVARLMRQTVWWASHAVASTAAPAATSPRCSRTTRPLPRPKDRGNGRFERLTLSLSPRSHRMVTRSGCSGQPARCDPTHNG